MASILIGDDDAAIRDALGEAARDLGHDIPLGRSGTEANCALLDALAIRGPPRPSHAGMDGI